MRNRLISGLVGVLLLASSSALAAAGKDVDLKAGDGTKIKATYYSAGKPGPGVVLLHMCNSQRKVWDNLAQSLAARGIHTITMDYRGYGESGGKPHLGLANPEQGRLVNEMWPGDVDKAFDYLVAQPGVDKNRIGASGGSCGVHQAVQLARRHPEVKTLVLLAGGTNGAGQDYLASSPWLPILGVTAKDDGDATGTMEWILGFSSNPANKHKVYDKGGHGTDLFPVYKDLEPSIVAWFEQHLVKQPVVATKTAAQPGPSARLAAAMREPGGPAKVLAQLREARKSGKPYTLAPEGAINFMGYEMIQGGRVADGLALFEINVEAHPESPNVYDSLADGYVAAGDQAKAREFARKALDALAKDKTLPEEAKKGIRDSAEAKLKPPATK